MTSEASQGRCRTCRWWEKYPRTNWGNCACGDNACTYRYYPTFGSSVTMLNGGDDMQRQDVLSSGPDFGCVHWEARDDE